MAEGAVVLTGALGGIGRAISETLIGAGYRVIGIDKEAGDGDAFIQLDLETALTEPEALVTLRDKVRSACAGAPLTALVNNAAVQKLGHFEAIELRDWQSTLNNNLTVPFVLSQLFVCELSEAAGSIVNISSVHAAATKPSFVSYAASKAGLEGLTRALAVELGGRVRVNAIRPAAIRTPMLEAGFAGNPGARKALDAMHPLARIGEPAEIAEAVKFLISGAASFISGAVLDVDGGILSRLHDPE